MLGWAHPHPIIIPSQTVHVRIGPLVRLLQCCYFTDAYYCSVQMLSLIYSQRYPITCQICNWTLSTNVVPSNVLLADVCHHAAMAQWLQHDKTWQASSVCKMIYCNDRCWGGRTLTPQIVSSLTAHVRSEPLTHLFRLISRLM